LEVLRHCLPPSVRRTLDELPESLDETYKRVLQEIKKPNREHARRLLQCLVVAIRPLRVEELAEVLAVDFDDEETPKLNPNWRWEDQEQALLSSCSSLITIVDTDKSRVVQFSHFSVKEFLTSPRLSTSNGDISCYHIILAPAHTILAQACMSVLLRSDDCVEDSGVRNDSPLAGYAAEHWATHAQDEKVSTRLRKAMEYLFDVDKPYFAAWLEFHDTDTYSWSGSAFHLFTVKPKSGATPLYYAAWRGFHDLVEHLIINDPKHVNAEGGYYVTPQVAALAAGHFRTAKFLHDNGAHPNVRGWRDNTPLHSAAYYGKLKIVQELLKYKADVNARNAFGDTPLHHASEGFSSFGGGLDITLPLSNIARLLLEHGADVNARGERDSTPLHVAAQYGRVEVVQVLLEHVANLGAEDDDRKTTCQVVSDCVDARNAEGKTPLYFASQGSYRGVNTALSHIARLLLEHGADINALSEDRSTPLHIAARDGRVEVVRVLLEYGANVGLEDGHGRSALQVASNEGHDVVMKFLSEHCAGKGKL
jgi:ankyrin repeat protein